MSGDLEDFLRRAAQRRQAKAAQQQQQQPAPRPQYSDSRTERRVRSAEPEEVFTAEIVEEDSSSIAARLRRIEEAKRAAKKAEAEVAQAIEKAKTRGGSKLTDAAPLALSGNPAQDLLTLLRRPGGIQQAILLREILQRPEHRW